MDYPAQPRAPAFQFSCARWFSSFVQLMPFSIPSWHTACQHRLRTFFAPGTPCRRLKWNNKRNIHFDYLINSAAKPWINRPDCTLLSYIIIYRFSSQKSSILCLIQLFNFLNFSIIASGKQVLSELHYYCGVQQDKPQFYLVNNYLFVRALSFLCNTWPLHKLRQTRVSRENRIKLELLLYVSYIILKAKHWIVETFNRTKKKCTL